MPTDHPDTAPSDLAPAARGTAIRSAEVLVTSPDRNFVTLRITTEDGVVGLGDATLNGRELSVASYLSDHVVPLLLGRDAHRIEDTWQFLYRSRVLAAGAGDHGGDRRGRRGPVGHQGEGRRAAAVPAARRGQPDRDHGVRARERPGPARAVRLDPARTRSRASAPSACRPSVPGIDAVYGVAAQPSSSGRYDYEPAQRAPLPAEEDWDTRAYLRHIPTVFEAVRNEFGPEVPLLHDGHHRMTPIQAARLGKDLEPYDLFWLEDCTPAENQEALRLVRQHTTTPLAIGEVFNTVWDYQTLVREQLIDYVRSAVTHTGGISALRKILDFAAQYQIKSGIHGPTDISPVGMAAALHLDLAIHNFGIQEYMQHGARTDEVFRQSFTFEDGYLHPGEAAGLGVDLRRRRGRALPVRSRRTCRSTGSRTARCTTGDRPCTRCGCPTRRSGRSGRGACSSRSGRTTGRSRTPSSPRSRPPRSGSAGA